MGEIKKEEGKAWSGRRTAIMYLYYMSIEYERTNYNVKHILFLPSRCCSFFCCYIIIYTPILFYCYYYYYYELELGNMCVCCDLRSSRLHDLHLQATVLSQILLIFNQGHEVFMQKCAKLPDLLQCSVCIAGDKWHRLVRTCLQ